MLRSGHGKGPQKGEDWQQNKERQTHKTHLLEQKHALHKGSEVLYVNVSLQDKSSPEGAETWFLTRASLGPPPGKLGKVLLQHTQESTTSKFTAAP